MVSNNVSSRLSRMIRILATFMKWALIVWLEGLIKVLLLSTRLKNHYLIRSIRLSLLIMIKYWLWKRIMISFLTLLIIFIDIGINSRSLKKLINITLIIIMLRISVTKIINFLNQLKKKPRLVYKIWRFTRTSNLKVMN